MNVLTAEGQNDHELHKWGEKKKKTTLVMAVV
jgi:hypothetical protein